MRGAVQSNVAGALDGGVSVSVPPGAEGEGHLLHGRVLRIPGKVRVREDGRPGHGADAGQEKQYCKELLSELSMAC